MAGEATVHIDAVDGIVLAGDLVVAVSAAGLVVLAIWSVETISAPFRTLLQMAARGEIR